MVFGRIRYGQPDKPDKAGHKDICPGTSYPDGHLPPLKGECLSGVRSGPLSVFLAGKEKGDAIS